MKVHDNTLYVTTQTAYLACQGTNVLVRIDKQVRLRLPIHTIGGIVCFGNVGCSPFLMGLCGKQGVSITFLTMNGRFLARVNGPQSGNVLLRRAQHRATSDPASAAGAARVIVSAKIANSRTVLQRLLRDHGDRLDINPIQRVAHRLGSLLQELQQPLDLERVRGVEGEAAAQYFAVFDHLILSEKQAFFFRERSRRPHCDKMNALI